MLDKEPIAKTRVEPAQQHRSLPTDIWDRENREFIESPVATKRASVSRLFCQFLVCLTIGLSVPYFVKWGYDHFYANNSDLTLTHLVFETDGSLTQQEVVDVAGVQIGASLAKLNLIDLKNRITSIPGVKSVEVERDFPDRLAITIIEREPVAWLSCPIHRIRPLREGGVFIDSESVIFECRELSADALRLPTIEANPDAAPQMGEQLDLDVVRGGLFLVESSQQQKLAESFGLELVDIRPVGNWGVLCRYSNNLLATFDLSQLERGQRDFLQVLETTSENGLKLATINLAPSKNIPVTFKTDD